MNRTWIPISLLAALALTGLARAAETNTSVSLAGRSVTVYPLTLEVQQRPADEEIATRIAEVLGLMLEKAGMGDVYIREDEWRTDQEDFGEAFSAHIRSAPPTTDTAMWVRFTGVQGLDQIDWILGDRTGEVLVQNTAKFTDSSPADPVHACLFVARSLQALSDLDDPTTPAETEGRMARTLRERAGLPPPEEIEAAKARLRALNGAWDDACVVFPIRVSGPDEADPALAGRMAELLVEAGLGKPVAATTALDLDVTGDPNQMKVLWDTARAFRDHLRSSPPDAPYALLVECGPVPTVSYVHVILCDRNGDWVVVDMQNHYHADFQEINPNSAEDCLQVAVRRLRVRLRDAMTE